MSIDTIQFDRIAVSFGLYGNRPDSNFSNHSSQSPAITAVVLPAVSFVLYGNQPITYNKPSTAPVSDYPDKVTVSSDLVYVHGHDPVRSNRTCQQWWLICRRIVRPIWQPTRSTLIHQIPGRVIAGINLAVSFSPCPPNRPRSIESTPQPAVVLNSPPCMATDLIGSDSTKPQNSGC